MTERRMAGRMVAEFLVIVVSILAAFGVEEFREQRGEAELEAVALANVRAEVDGNIAAIEAVLPYHEEVAQAVGELLADPARWRGRAGFEVGASAAPRGVMAPDLRTTAWQTAHLTGAVGLIDYELSERIASVYDAQALGVDATVGRLVDHVFTLDTFEPDRTGPVITLLGALAGELASQERQLLELLRELSAALD